MKNSVTLYLIRGIPGSGKTTFAESLFYASLVDRVFEADQFFIDNEGEYKFNASKLGEAHTYCQNNTRYALKAGWNVAVSNTSTTEKEVETYRKIAEECDADFVSIVVENRHGGVNQHNVPENKIQQMKQRFSIKL